MNPRITASMINTHYLWTSSESIWTSGGRRLSTPEEAATTPLISIIIATYNAITCIHDAISSILRQCNFNDYEIIVIDGASTDGTVEALKEYGDQIEYWISEKDSGIYDAWNKGLALARGRYIAFLGSDDTYEPNALSHYKDYIQQYPECEYISSRVQLHANGKNTRVIGKAWTWGAFCRYMNVAHGGSLHSAELYKRLGGYDTRYRIVGDYDLLLRAHRHLKAGFMNVVTVRMSLGGISNLQAGRAYKETRQAKITNNARSVAWANFDYVYAHAKLIIRKMLFK